MRRVTTEEVRSMRGSGRYMTMALGLSLLAGCAAEQAADEQVVDGIPSFESDTEWPRNFPQEWLIGPGTGVYVDAKDHVWLLQRPERVSVEDFAAARAGRGFDGCCTNAPPVIEVDPEGNIVQTWDGLGVQADWPIMPHGIFVDHNDFVWIATSIHHQVMKFTRQGEHLLTIGEFDAIGGSNDPRLLGGSADLWVDPATNELFVADGYDNRRIIVFNAENGEYLRHWGAYGDAPSDDVPGGRPEEGAPPPPYFSLVHGIAGSNDGHIYVADRTNSRLQVFRPNGEFVTEKVLRPGAGAAFDVAFSNDPEQRFIYVADGTRHMIMILRRSDLEVLGEFGGEGVAPGQMGRPHNLAADSKGNLYVAEADPGRRFQKFSFKGMLQQ